MSALGGIARRGLRLQRVDRYQIETVELGKQSFAAVGEVAHHKQQQANP